MLSAVLLLSAQSGQTLPTGKTITPIGTHASVGSYPVNMATTPDGKYAVVTTVGFRQFLSVLDVKTGRVVSQLDFNGRADRNHKNLYYGLAMAPDRTLYVSNGATDLVGRFRVEQDGRLTDLNNPVKIEAPKERGLPMHPAGLAVNSDASWLFVVNNQTNDKSDWKGSFSVVDTKSGKELSRVPTAGFPFAAAAITQGPLKNQKIFIGSERDGVVQSFEASRGMKPVDIRTGEAVTGLLLSADQKTLFVSNAGSDTVSFVDTATDTVKATVLLRPAAVRGLLGCTPTGMALSPDGHTLYVALQDMNAVAVVSVRGAQLRGYIPTGWLPTSLVATKDSLLVAVGKGVKAQNPNDKPVDLPGLVRPDRYIQNIIDGAVTRIPVPSAKALKHMTSTVLKNNRIFDASVNPSFKNPGIKHVIYVIKENRTYDNVLGDIPKGNGDASQTLFPRKVTPNQHALVDRFVLMDNFHVCAEVSQDGWQWSTSGILSPYASRNTPYNYSGRGRNYDTEGENNNLPVDLLGVPDVARPASGYIWELCAANGVTYRNYGFFTSGDDPDDKRFGESVRGNHAAKKALIGHTDDHFRQYDNDYPDGDAYASYAFSWPTMRKEYGVARAISRIQEWRREFSKFVDDGEMPQFQMVRLGNDHTQGTRVDKPTPQSCVADNDYAVGQLVETVSKSPFWKDTAIFILEDDAQNGYDHVDAHRSTAYVISPFVKRSALDSRFYNTDSMLRTMELLLGLPPMNQYDAVAAPLDVFSARPENMEPFTALLPDKDVVCALNTRASYRSADSEMLSVYREESRSDEDLNDILWGAVMGQGVPRPRVKNAFR